MSGTILFTGCGADVCKGYSEPEDAAVACLEAEIEPDGEKLLSAVPQEAIDYVLDNYDISERELINKLEDYIKYTDSLELWTKDLSYEIVNVDYHSDTDVFKEAEDGLKRYNMNVSIENVCTVEFDVKGIEGGMSTSQDLMKISGNWYTVEMIYYPAMAVMQNV